MNFMPARITTMFSSAAPSLHGIGIGFREAHAIQIIQTKPDIAWLEVLTDNFFCAGGLPHRELEELREHYPIALHSVAMSLGSVDPIDWDYMNKIKQLAKRYRPSIISDHLCFSSGDGIQFHDLLPLPHTEEAVVYVAQRIREVQDFLEHTILIENISSYVSYTESRLNEAEFINAVATTADCNILLDLNNLYVNAYNHNHSLEQNLNTIDLTRVKQIHLAGFEDKGDYLLDAHSREVATPVWELFSKFIQRHPRNAAIPVLLEWDNDIPTLETLLAQAQTAQNILAAA